MSCISISLSLDVDCWLALVGAHVARSTETVMGMPSFPIVRVCGYPDITGNGPSERVRDLPYVLFAVSLDECVAAAKSSGWSANMN